MEYEKIIAVTGLPGLYEMVSSKSDGAIVRSLEDQSTRFVSSRIHNFSHLESIEVFTVRENVNLVEVFEAMEKSGEQLPDEKDNNQLKSYFGKVYADMDFDRVYTSDLKKMVKWFAQLKACNIEIKLPEPPPEEEPAPAPVVEEVKKKDPKKETKEVKATKPEPPAKKAAEPTPKKKAVAKKETAEKKAEPKKKAAAPAKKEVTKKAAPAKKKTATKAAAKKKSTKK